MNMLTPETNGAPAENPHVLLAQFLDESVQLAKKYSRQAIWAEFANLALKAQPLAEVDTLFRRAMDISAQAVNIILQEQGGTPVVFDFEPTGRVIRGTVIGCTGYSVPTQKWNMVVEEATWLPAFPNIPVQTRIPVDFSSGELLESYQRASGE